MKFLLTAITYVLTILAGALTAAILSWVVGPLAALLITCVAIPALATLIHHHRRSLRRALRDRVGRQR